MTETAVLLLLLLAGGLQGQSLYGEDVACSAGDGERVEVAGITDTNPCISCYCHRGTKTCRDESKLCPSVKGCYSLKPRPANQCCRECADCAVNSTRVMGHGAREEDKCQDSQCWDGVVTRSKRSCSSCGKEAKEVEGQCCASCPSCRWQGESLQEGESRQDISQPCRRCTCSGGRLQCSLPSCPVLPCPLRLQMTPRGSCCPLCSRAHNSYFSPAGKCFFREKVYSPGQSFRLDPCTSCSCSSGLTVTCSRAADCQQPASRLTCTHRKTQYSHGQKWRVDQCTQCTCKLGRVDCSPAACPACPAGSQQVPAPGMDCHG